LLSRLGYSILAWSNRGFSTLTTRETSSSFSPQWESFAVTTSKMRGQRLGDICHSFGWKGRRRQPAFGEGGGKGGAYFTQRYAGGTGLNSLNLDFLPIQNIEETDFDTVVGGIVGAVPGEDRKNDQL
jgi:hypothetical protein